MSKNPGKIGIWVDSLQRITETSEQYFDTVRQIVIEVLRDRGDLPADLASPDMGETVIMFAAEDAAADSLIAKAANILASLRVALTPQNIGRVRHAKQYLETGGGRGPSSPHELVILGVELRRFLESSKAGSTQQKYSYALSYFIKKGCPDQITAKEIFNYLEGEGFDVGDPENFRKTFQDWRPKWQGFKVAMILEDFANFKG